MSISRDVLQACVHPTTDWTEGIKFGPDQTSGPYPVGLSQENRTPIFGSPGPNIIIEIFGAPG